VGASGCDSPGLPGVVLSVVGRRDWIASGVDRLRTRLRRQEELYEPGKQLRFLVTEAALRYRPCTPATLRGQLDRLLAISGLDTVELAVIPFAHELPMLPPYWP